jgi:hypothetical protein
MKIIVWIRPDKDGKPTERVDYKLENQDTPRIQNFGFRLIRAMTGEEIEEIQRRGGSQC